MVTNNNIPIVMYHCINDYPKENPLGFLAYSADDFRQQLSFFCDHNYTILTLNELFQRAVDFTIGNERIAVLTFDDGFLDNYLVAAKIMREFDIKGTIFVNPGHADEGESRSLADIPKAWGYLNFNEMRQLEKLDLFDIQSHTMTHEMIFSSNRVIDLYDPSKFDQYYWLIWMLFPETLKQWHGDVRRFKEHVPTGYPIFEYDRALSRRKYVPSETFVKKSCHLFYEHGDDALAKLQDVKAKGNFESEEEYLTRVRWQLDESKHVLEAELNKEIFGLCFPGGSYNEHVLQIAEEAGYRLFMLSSRHQAGDNIRALNNFHSNSFVGLKRISFTKEYPQFLHRKKTVYWNAKLKVGTFMKDPTSTRIMSMARTTRNVMQRLWR